MASRPSCRWKSIAQCHSLHTCITAIAQMVSNKGHWLTYWVWYPCFQSICNTRLVFGPNELPWMTFGLALQAELAKLWRHNDLIYARRLIMMLLSTTSHCSKPSGSLATVHTRVPITTATMCDESLIFFQDCHFIDSGYESPRMMHLENRGLEIWYKLFQNKVRLFIMCCYEDGNQSPTFSMDSTWHCPWLKVHI